MKTILITGCSSGFGLDIARHFLAREWRVIATMRTPDASLLPSSGHLRLLALDVTDAGSIRQAIAEAGPIDVLVNNAGIGMLGAVEGTPLDLARQVFETNTLGTIAMTQAVLPQMRERRDGVIINVTSSVTLKPLPLLAIYTGSKAAVNAYTESLALELAAFDIRAHLVLPGRAPSTRFGANAQQRIRIPQAYAALAEKVFADWSQQTAVTLPQDVVTAVWRAATDAATPLRLAAGADTEALTS
ncbi:SDR family oxidoreductase [Duganella callida]|uniref:SDR family oxidoreductase n=1 Tax=Duganella callida TaxID=2561932 RepID=A0A4Y9SBC8_9BURK|nr:SDR family oxidoreductase [Duganella callida]TFW19113.1 SDR family oxidoreductase [Duganella callida]